MEDFDFVFIESMMEANADEIDGMINTCVEDLSNIGAQQEELEVGDIISQVHSQVHAIGAIRQQFAEFIKRTAFVKTYAKQKQNEMEGIENNILVTEKALEDARHKSAYLEVRRLRTNTL